MASEATTSDAVETPVTYALNLEDATFAGMSLKKPTKTLDGEEHEPAKVVLKFEVPVERIHMHLNSLARLYALLDGKLQRLGLAFADQPSLWEARRKDVDDEGAVREIASNSGHDPTATSNVTPIGKRQRKTPKED